MSAHTGTPNAVRRSLDGQYHGIARARSPAYTTAIHRRGRRWVMVPRRRLWCVPTPGFLGGRWRVCYPDDGRRGPLDPFDSGDRLCHPLGQTSAIRPTVRILGSSAGWLRVVWRSAVTQLLLWADPCPLPGRLSLISEGLKLLRKGNFHPVSDGFFPQSAYCPFPRRIVLRMAHGVLTMGWTAYRHGGPSTRKEPR